MISPETTVARLLQEHPETLAVLERYHDHFRELRHRLLRGLMAPRLTLAQAARIAGVPTQALLAALRREVGEVADPTCWSDDPPGGGPPAAAGAGAEATPARPAWLQVSGARLVEIDVREDIARGREPFGRIMAVVRALAPGQVLVLRAPFEPLPLYEVLGRRGFAHFTERRGEGDWVVWFGREGEPSGGATTGPDPGPAGSIPAGPPGPRDWTSGQPQLSLDVRGLEPPLPMVRVLEALDALAPGQTLEVIHERRPVFLYPQLDARGFAHRTEEAGPGRVRILIQRGPRPA